MDKWRASMSAMSINRNIMECKGKCNDRRNNGYYSINRNIMECKDMTMNGKQK